MNWMMSALFSAMVMSAPVMAAEQTTWRFTFGTDHNTDGAIAVGKPSDFNADQGYGFELGNAPQFSAKAAVGERYFQFSVHVPEGNYKVTAVLGGGTQAGDTLVKAESRRVMTSLERTDADKTQTVEFAVNVRGPNIEKGRRVSLLDREKSSLTWDDRLTLEFVGQRPELSSLTIEPATSVTTVFIAGDSTVTDAGREPWSGWGQMLPRYFNADVVFANHAESGRTLSSFQHQRRWDKILSQIKPGDYVLIQFGHNDMKEKNTGGPFGRYSDLLREFVKNVRDRQGNPILVTPMNRRWFDGDKVRNTFGEYPDAVRKVAEEVKAPLIDLNAMTKTLYEAMGPEGAKQLFVFYPAGTFNGQKEALKDNSHFRPFGADELAKCIIQGMRDLKLPLVDKLRPGLPSFDPAHPDDPATFDVPLSAAGSVEKPEGD